jgi:ligand-binding SRPBCC domain-containing protein
VETGWACRLQPSAFDLSLDIGVHLDSMAGSGERAVGGVTSGLIGVGESVTWNARHFGISWRMTSTITSWDRPRSFVDEQARGPFHHEHRFEPTDDGCPTTDGIVFRSPFGLLGNLVDTVVNGGPTEF